MPNEPGNEQAAGAGNEDSPKAGTAAADAAGAAAGGSTADAAGAASSGTRAGDPSERPQTADGSEEILFDRSQVPPGLHGPATEVEKALKARFTKKTQELGALRKDFEGKQAALDAQVAAFTQEKETLASKAGAYDRLIADPRVMQFLVSLENASPAPNAAAQAAAGGTSEADLQAERDRLLKVFPGLESLPALQERMIDAEIGNLTSTFYEKDPEAKEILAAEAAQQKDGKAGPLMAELMRRIVEEGRYPEEAWLLVSRDAVYQHRNAQAQDRAKKSAAAGAETASGGATSTPRSKKPSLQEVADSVEAKVFGTAE